MPLSLISSMNPFRPCSVHSASFALWRRPQIPRPLPSHVAAAATPYNMHSCVCGSGLCALPQIVHAACSPAAARAPAGEEHRAVGEKQRDCLSSLHGFCSASDTQRCLALQLPDPRPVWPAPNPALRKCSTLPPQPATRPARAPEPQQPTSSAWGRPHLQPQLLQPLQLLHRWYHRSALPPVGARHAPSLAKRFHQQRTQWQHRPGTSKLCEASASASVQRCALASPTRTSAKMPPTATA